MDYEDRNPYAYFMTSRVEKETKGAWIIHHGRKIALDVNAPAEFPVLDESAKAAELLMRLGQSDSATLSKNEAEAVARAAHLNPRSELPHYLGLLEARRLIDRSATEIRVLGVTTRAALSHASDILTDAGPSTYEEAAIDLAELTSQSPQSLARSAEYISDTHRIASKDTQDLIQRSVEIGFVDYEGESSDGLLFNGNLFKRDTVAKSKAVLSSLSSEEQTKVTEFDEILKRTGCVLAAKADSVLGRTLFEKLKAASVYEINTVSNENGEYAFVNSPGAFHKFVNPLIDDSFDLAKALVSALTYGMTLRHPSRGRIISVDWILGALIAGRTIGPATAIGNDYRVLEESRVVQLTSAGNGMFRMRLLKREIGELALQVLTKGDANAEVMTVPPSSPMTGYIGPEQSRVRVRRNQKQPSKRATRDILGALRGGRAI
jgi:hypothetical protein